MATLAIRDGKTPSYEVQFFISKSGKRTTIYLGGRRYSQKTAKELKEVVETLTYYKHNAITVPDKRTLAWLESAPAEIREKLSKVGLIEIPKTHTLKELWNTYTQQKTGVKESTEKIYECSRHRFFWFFKENEEVSDLTQQRMQQWKDSLREKLAEATIAGTIAKTKAVFNWAVQAGWIEKSPLDGVKKGSFINRSNDWIVTMDDYCRLLKACPCKDWRTIIALVRIGGLRCPSEVLQLRWIDVNWEKNLFHVRSPKTEHHEGKEDRLVPIFHELKEELEALFFDPDSEGKEFIINCYRDPKKNLRDKFALIVKRAGLRKIPRPFDNMRMTRSNEIYDRFGPFKESQWIGHSDKVRNDHYLMVQDSDYHEAAD